MILREKFCEEIKIDSFWIAKGVNSGILEEFVIAESIIESLRKVLSLPRILFLTNALNV